MNEINSNGYCVRLSENAMISLVFSACEAYATEKQLENKLHPLESTGHLFGQIITLDNKKTLIHVEKVQPCVTAAMNSGWCVMGNDAIHLMEHLASSFWPNIQYIGGFHTHPYLTHDKLKSALGYYLSPGDRDWLVINGSDLQKKASQKHGYQLEIVVAIANTKNRSNKINHWLEGHDNVVCMYFGNLRIYISAFVAYENNNSNQKYQYTADNPSIQSPQVYLDIPSACGLVYEYSNFGKIIGERKKRHTPQ